MKFFHEINVRFMFGVSPHFAWLIWRSFLKKKRLSKSALQMILLFWKTNSSKHNADKSCKASNTTYLIQRDVMGCYLPEKMHLRNKIKDGRVTNGIRYDDGFLWTVFWL